MTRYSLSSDSTRWWWPAASAGTAAAALIASVLFLPAAVQSGPAPLAPAEPASGVVYDSDRDRPCFMVRAHWNEALDGPQPRCSSGEPASRPHGVLRPGLAYLP